MDFNELNAQWQERKVPSELDQDILEKIKTFDSTLKKENLKLTYWLAGTIYLTGCIVFPFLKTSMSMFLMAGVWFLIGFQAIVFWLRQSTLKQSMIDQPERFINAKLSKLGYNLLVTNVFMPVYLILLGILSSLYLSNVLIGVGHVIISFVVVFNCLFYIIVFSVFWKRQRKRDFESIAPQIKELEKIKAGYNNL